MVATLWFLRSIAETAEASQGHLDRLDNSIRQKKTATRMTAKAAIVFGLGVINGGCIVILLNFEVKYFLL